MPTRGARRATPSGNHRGGPGRRRARTAWRAALCAALVAAAAGCAVVKSRPTKEGAQVRMLPNPEDFPQCLLLDDLRSVALVGPDNSYHQALTRFRNKVGQLGGTHMTLTFSETDDLATTIEGVAFRCPLDPEGNISQDPGHEY